MSSNSYFEKVYDLTQLIPVGRVSTYGAIADFLSLGSARMVGWALNKCGNNGQNIPAHRVVNRKGELTGRRAFIPQSLMQDRLEKEGVEVRNHIVQNFDEVFWHPENLLKHV